MRIEIIIGVICFIGIPAGGLILYFLQNRKAYSNFANNLGFSVYKTLAEYDEGNQLEKQLEGFYLFREDINRKFINIIVGKIGDFDVKIFDNEYITGRTEHGAPITRGNTVFFFESEGLNFPKFQLRARGKSLEKEIKIPFLSHKEIDFDPPLLIQDQQVYQYPHPKFTSKYLLRGPNHSSIRSLFNDEILSYFENQKAIMSVEAVGTKIIIYNVWSWRSHGEPTELAGHYNKVLEIFNLLKSRVLTNI